MFETWESNCQTGGGGPGFWRERIREGGEGKRRIGAKRAKLRIQVGFVSKTSAKKIKNK